MDVLERFLHHYKTCLSVLSENEVENSSLSEVENYSPDNFGTFQILNVELWTKLKIVEIFQLGSRDMTIFGEWAWYKETEIWQKCP